MPDKKNLTSDLDKLTAKEIAQELKAAFRCGDFEAGQRWSDSFGRAAVDEIRQAPPQRRAALLAESLAVIEDNLSLARVLRAHIASQLKVNTAVYLYQPDAEHAHIWGYDA